MFPGRLVDGGKRRRCDPLSAPVIGKVQQCPQHRHGGKAANLPPKQPSAHLIPVLSAKKEPRTMGSAAPVYAVFSRIIQEIQANIRWTSSIYTAVPSGNGEQHVPLPAVQRRHRRHRDAAPARREALASQVTPLQAVHHQKAHHGRRQHPPQVGHRRRRLPVFRKQPEGQPPGQLRPGSHRQDDAQRLHRCQCASSPPLSPDGPAISGRSAAPPGSAPWRGSPDCPPRRPPGSQPRRRCR